ncbi:MAG: HAMP domain-containing protein [Hyphomonadaceae bacterium]|nr:HAMP domain-containing protein [Clostridia bacterium]
MLKKIFTKLLLVYCFIILISFGFLSVLVFQYLNNYVIDEKENALRTSVLKVEEMTTAQLEDRSVLSARILRINLEYIALNTKAVIMIVEKSGKIIMSTGANANVFEDKNIDMKSYAAVLNGDTVKKVGDFDALFKDQVLTIAAPMHYSGEVIGAIFMHTHIPEINQARNHLFSLFFKSLLVTFIVAFILIYFISRRISKPLKLISQAARTISDGKFENRVVVSSNDEIGELATTFNHMADALQNLEKMRKSFIANISHELRTPMTTIHGFIEGIMDGTIPEHEQQKYFKIVLSEVQRLSRLVNNLLDLAKMEAKTYAIEIKSFDINEMVRINLIKFEQAISQKDIQVDVHFEQAQCMVLADPDAIARVLTNLIDNAIKFSKENGSLVISLAQHAQKVHIKICDDGIGISEEDMKYIWDRFYKSDQSRSVDKIGAGLGLAMVKHIIKEHGQDIWVSSQLDEYTCFEFTLPLFDA